MFLRKTRTSKSSLIRLMLIWILLVRKNQKSSVNPRKRRRKKHLLNSILQHLCLHHQLCCQMLLPMLSLTWWMRLLMPIMSLLHELSTNKMFVLALFAVLALVNAAPIVNHKVLNPYDTPGVEVARWSFKSGGRWMVIQEWRSLDGHSRVEVASQIPRACVSFRTVCSAWPKYDFGYLMSPDVYVVTTTVYKRQKYELNSLAFTPEGAQLFYTLVGGYAHERRKLIKEGRREELPNLDACLLYTPTESQ
uniref:ORF7 protein n=1 Tax=Bat Coronavirus MpGD16 TaxID=3018851 RepID=A0AA49I9Z0_9NIDO|nr:ORF7 protein [Bat Coronavirus MpGD16]